MMTESVVILDEQQIKNYDIVKYVPAYIIKIQTLELSSSCNNNILSKCLCSCADTWEFFSDEKLNRTFNTPCLLNLLFLLKFNHIVIPPAGIDWKLNKFIFLFHNISITFLTMFGNHDATTRQTCTKFVNKKNKLSLLKLICGNTIFRNTNIRIFNSKKSYLS